MKRVAAAITGCLLALAPAAEGSVLDDDCGLCGLIGAGITVSDPPSDPPPSNSSHEVLPSGWILLSDAGFEDWHHDWVKEQLTSIGVEDSLILSDEDLYMSIDWHDLLFGDPYKEVLPHIRVVNMSWSIPFVDTGVAKAIKEHNVLFVNSAGNTPLFPAGHPQAGIPDPSKRDRYVPDGYLPWNGERWTDHDPKYYEETMAALATDKVILAVWAAVDRNGNIVPQASSVRCGEAKESCFSLVLPPEWRDWGRIGTSRAAPRLSAYAFYLFQLWDKAEEVTHTLRDCAQDIGEPGVDDEFGQGIAHVDCDKVADREQEVTKGSTQLAVSSPTLDHETGEVTANASTAGVGLAVPLAGNGRTGASLLLTRNYRALSLAADIGRTTTLLSVGTGTQPLGVSSVFLPQGRKPFLEIGATREFRFANGLSASLLGAHGRANNVSVTRLGVALRAGTLPLSVYTGAAFALALADIPGRAAAGRPLIPVRTLSPEIRLRWDLPLPSRRSLF